MRRWVLAAVLLVGACRTPPPEAAKPWEGLPPELGPEAVEYVRGVADRAQRVQEAYRRGRVRPPAPGTVRIDNGSVRRQRDP